MNIIWKNIFLKYFIFCINSKAPGQKPPDKSPPDKKPPNNEIIIQSYYICFISKDILKNINTKNKIL
jgi:hypothetical protein